MLCEVQVMGVLTPGPLFPPTQGLELVSAVMFSGVAIMVSEGRGPGHHQLPAVKEVPQLGSLAFIPLPCLQQLLLLPLAGPLPSPCLSNRLCQQCPWWFAPITGVCFH